LSNLQRFRDLPGPEGKKSSIPPAASRDHEYQDLSHPLLLDMEILPVMLGGTDLPLPASLKRVGLERLTGLGPLLHSQEIFA